MAKAKRKRWVCPKCEKGKLGKIRPRKNDIIRYCLSCSKKTGYLVERVPATEFNKGKTEVAKPTVAKTTTKAKKLQKIKASWISNPRYQYTKGFHFCHPQKINLMLAAQVLCKLSGWKRPQVFHYLWKRTVSTGKGTAAKNPITIRRTHQTWSSTGRAWHGAIITAGTCFARSLNTLLHELCHVDQEKVVRVNGVRRPHDLAFNMQQFKLAKKLWGYDTLPEDAGWSIGKGYAPTRHLEKWMVAELKKSDSQLTKWVLKHCVDTGTFAKAKTKTKTKTKTTPSRYSWELMYYDGRGDFDTVDLSKDDWKRKVKFQLRQWRLDVVAASNDASIELNYMPFFELKRWDSKTGDGEEFEIGTAQKRVSKIVMEGMALIPLSVQMLEERLEREQESIE